MFQASYIAPIPTEKDGIHSCMEQKGQGLRRQLHIAENQQLLQALDEQGTLHILGGDNKPASLPADLGTLLTNIGDHAYSIDKNRDQEYLDVAPL